MSNNCLNDIQFFKVTELPLSGEPDSVYFWLDNNTVRQYVTNSNGALLPSFNTTETLTTLVRNANSLNYTDEAGSTTTITLNSVAFSGDYQDLINTPQNTSEFTNDGDGTNRFAYINEIPTDISDLTSSLQIGSALQFNSTLAYRLELLDQDSAVMSTVDIQPSNIQDLENFTGFDARYYLKTEVNDFFSGTTAITGYNKTNWDEAYSWGDHSTAGYLTSLSESDPVFTASVAATISSGDISNWNTAFGWGDHALSGYLTSYTETDPVFLSSVASTIALQDITEWNLAYTERITGATFSSATGVLTLTKPDSVDITTSLDGRYALTTHTHVFADITGLTASAVNWDLAFSWGDHDGLYLPITGGTLQGNVQGLAGTEELKNFGRLDLTNTLYAGSDTITSNFVTADLFTIGQPVVGNNLEYRISTGNWAIGGDNIITEAPNDGQEYVRQNQAWVVASAGGGGGAVWGAITGTLSNQTDLQTALDNIALTQIVDIQAGRFLGRTTVAGAGAPTELTVAQVKTELAYAASEITVSPAVNSLTDVQSVLEDLDSRVGGGGGSSSWGSITGTLSAQTDLQAALDLKLNAATYTAADVLAKLLTVDGSGTGLDADLLDGVEASSFLRSDVADTAEGAITFTSGGGAVTFDNTGNQGILTGADTQRLLVGGGSNWNATSGAYLVLEGLDFAGVGVGGNAAFNLPSGKNLLVNANVVWHAGNDGAGSLLDADLLDGVDGSNYARTDIAETFTNNVTVNGTLTSVNVNLTDVFRMYDGSNNSHQRGDSRTDGVDEARIHWYGVNNSGNTRSFKHAFYDFNSTEYVNVTAASGLQFVHQDTTSGNDKYWVFNSNTQGDSILQIVADTDNNNENDIPRLQFLTDGNNGGGVGAPRLEIGTAGDAGVPYSGLTVNRAYIFTDVTSTGLDFVNNTEVHTEYDGTGNWTFEKTVGFGRSSIQNANVNFHKSDGASMGIAWEDDFYRYRRTSGGSVAGWRWDNFDTTAASLTTGGVFTANEVIVDNEAYVSGWNGDLSVPTKNAVYDQLESLTSEGSGSSGMVLEGSTSGTYTIGAQSWGWYRYGKMVTFYISLSNVNGTTPLGNLRIDTSGTSLPFLTGTNVFAVETNGIGNSFYSIHAINIGAAILEFRIQTALDANNQTAVINSNFSGTEDIFISGSFITT